MRTHEIPIADGILSVDFTISDADESTGFKGALEIESIMYISDDGKIAVDVAEIFSDLDKRICGAGHIEQYIRDDVNANADDCEDTNPLDNN